MYIYKYVCIHIYIYMYQYIYTQTYMYIQLCKHMYLYIHVHTHIHIYIHAYMCMHKCVYIFLSVCGVLKCTLYTTCPCTTSWSAYFRLVTLFLFKKTRQSTIKCYRGKLHHTMVDSWYCLDRVVPKEMSQVARQLEVGNHKRRTLNTRLFSGTSAGTFAVSTGPYINFRDETGTKNELDPDIFLYQFKKRVGKSMLTFRT